MSRFDFLTLWITDVGAGSGEWKVTKTSAAQERDKLTQKTRSDKEAECMVGTCWRWSYLCHSANEKERTAQNGLSNGESHGTLLRWKCQKRRNCPDRNSVFRVTLQIALYNLGTHTISMLGKVSLILFRPLDNHFLLML